MSTLLNLAAAPADPIERLMWLSGVQQKVKDELEAAYAEAYFTARFERRFDAALAAGPFARKRALALTRQENQRRGRTVRWNDGLDPSSTTFEG